MTSDPRPQRHLSIAVFIILAGFGLRMWQLGTASLWIDEAWSARMANTPVSEMLLGTLLRLGMIELPLYISSLHLFPTGNELLLRFPSVAASTISIAVFIMMVRRLYSQMNMALWAGALLATNPLHVWLGRTARPYAYLFLTTLLASMFFALLLQGRQRRGVWTGFILSSAAAYLTHYFALFLPLVQYVVLGVYLKRYRPMFRRWLGAQLLAGSGLLVLWGAQAILNHPIPAYIAWIPAPNVGDVLLTLANMITGSLRWYVLPGLVAGVVGITLQLGRLQLQRRTKPTIVYWALLAILPLFTGLLISMLVHPLYADRYFIEILPAVLILIIGGLWRHHGTTFRYSLSMLIVVSGVLSVIDDLRNGGFEREDWRGVTEYITENDEAGDGLLLEPTFAYDVFSYYFPVSTLPLLGSQDFRNITEYDLDRLWVVYRDPREDVHLQTAAQDFNPFDHRDGVTAVWLNAHVDQIVDERTFNGIRVLLVDMREP